MAALYATHTPSRVLQAVAGARRVPSAPRKSSLVKPQRLASPMRVRRALQPMAAGGAGAGAGSDNNEWPVLRAYLLELQASGEPTREAVLALAKEQRQLAKGKHTETEDGIEDASVALARRAALTVWATCIGAFHTPQPGPAPQLQQKELLPEAAARREAELHQQAAATAAAQHEKARRVAVKLRKEAAALRKELEAARTTA